MKRPEYARMAVWLVSDKQLVATNYFVLLDECLRKDGISEVY